MIAKQLTLRWEIILDYLDEPHVITRVLLNGREGRRERIRGMAAREGLNLLLLALKIEEGATSQGIQATSRSYRKGNGFFLGTSRRNATLLTL